MSDKSLLKTIERSFVWKKEIVTEDTVRPAILLGHLHLKGGHLR